MKKTLIVASCLALLVAGYIGLRLATAPTPGVTVENFRRIYVGMEFKVAQAILGESTNLYSNLWVWYHGDETRMFLLEKEDRVAHGVFYHGKDFGENVREFSIIGSFKQWLGSDKPRIWVVK